MKVLIEDCNNVDCRYCQPGEGMFGLICDLKDAVGDTATHSFAYNHSTGRLSCKNFEEEE